MPNANFGGHKWDNMKINMCDKDYKAVMDAKIGDTINLEHGGALDVIDGIDYGKCCKLCVNNGQINGRINGSFCYSCHFAINAEVKRSGRYLAFVEHVAEIRVAGKP